MTVNPDEQTQSVDLPNSPVSRIEDRLPRTKWETRDEYITYVLEEVLYHVEKETSDDFEAVEEEEVKERLESLGYLNE